MVAAAILTAMAFVPLESCTHFGRARASGQVTASKSTLNGYSHGDVQHSLGLQIPLGRGHTQLSSSPAQGRWPQRLAA